ncbi:hypothetical protein DL768_006462 [Monosporascus sp. mg162]|nr:hypothetical protein DL768_006462 [Monosporascus sp. mg162]
MAQGAIIESHVAVTQIPGLGPDTYANDKPLTTQPTGRAVFGGLLLAQAISAASATVPPEFYTYSSQSSFLRPVTAKAQDKVVYRVDRTVDGRTYATRVVRATQGAEDTCVYIAIISFQSGKMPTGNVLDYSIPMPELDGLRPDDIPKELNRQIMAASTSRGGPFQLFNSEGEPFDWRPFGFVLTDDPWECRTRGFSRSLPLSTDSTSVNLAALAYMSDEVLLGVPIYANPDKVGDRMQNVAMGVTLTHNISFHDPAVKVDQWMVAERETSWGADGRVLIGQRVWNLKTGRLVMTCTQEALIRLRDAKL